MDRRLYTYVTSIMLFMSMLIVSNIIYSSIKKDKIDQLSIVDLSDEDNDSEKETNSQLKKTKINFLTDDDICHEFEFMSFYSTIKRDHHLGVKIQETAKGFDKFVYSPPELA